MLQEESNENEFKTKRVTALKLMLEDSDTHDFGRYFRAKYMNNGHIVTENIVGLILNLCIRQLNV